MEVSTKQEQIAALAERYPDRGLTSLNKHLDEEWLCAAFAGLRKDGAVGVDGVSAKAYGEELEKRLPDLVDRAKSGRYRAPPVRRVYIDKPGKSEKRPLGIPTTEDKLLQKAVTMLLEPIYEREFYDFSYGFRPGRGCHDALEYMRSSIMKTRTGWIVEADIRNFFNAIPHDKVREILRQRVRDGVLTRLIDKTRLVAFENPRKSELGGGKEAKQSFDFLGFTHYWGRSRKGYWIILLDPHRHNPLT